MLICSEGDGQITRGFKVVLCDDQPQMRGGVRSVLTAMLGCDVVGEASTGEDAMGLVDEHEPDMLVLDPSLPGKLSGRAVLREIRRRNLPVKVFVHTEYLNREDFEIWLHDPEGPDGIDEKSTSDRELALGFTQVLLTEHKYVPFHLIRKFSDGWQSKPLDCLTQKEFMVLRLAIRPELDVSQIAYRLSNSSSTIRVHLAAIYTKLGLEQHNRAALMAFYCRHHHEIAP